MMFLTFAGQSLMFNRFACFLPKGYQRGSLGYSHQIGDFLKQAMRKSCLSTGSNPVGKQLFRIACFQ